MSIKDFEITVKIRNGRLIGLMQQFGIDKLTELAERSGVHLSTIHGLAVMKVSGRNIFGEWRPSVIKLSEFFGCMPEDLIPEVARDGPVTKTNVRTMANIEDAQVLVNSMRTLALPAGARLEQEQTLAAVRGLLDTLSSPRHAQVLKMRFGFDGDPKTLEEIGAEMKVGKARVRQIEHEALQQLKRRPGRLHRVAEQCGTKIYQKSWGLVVDTEDLLGAVSGEDG